MDLKQITYLPARSVIEVTGADRVGFLQGLVSNDVTAAAPGRSVWAALLTPQGKWLLDLFIRADGERLLLDVERRQAETAIKPCRASGFVPAWRFATWAMSCASTSPGADCRTFRPVRWLHPIRACPKPAGESCSARAASDQRQR